jgi:FixJ family two-component response regulator
MAQAVQQARRASEVVQRLRSVVERPDPAAGQQSVDLHETVRNALHLLEPELQRRSIRTEVLSALPGVRVLAEPVALEQIVHNLVMNALQALEQVPVGERRLTLQLRTEAALGELDVQIPAPGLRRTCCHACSSPSSPRAVRGLGLGLSLCETLTVNMGGTLTAAQPHAAGRQPAVAPASGRCMNPPASTLSPLIHLIDDDEAVRASLALLIGTVGLRVQAWADPQAFMGGFDRESIGAIVLDVRMPGISGLTVLDQLMAQGVDQPVIMLTGHGTVEMCRRAFKAGAAEFLEKPVDDELLLEALQNAVRQHVRRASGTRPTAQPASALRSCPSASARCWA